MRSIPGFPQTSAAVKTDSATDRVFNSSDPSLTIGPFCARSLENTVTSLLAGRVGDIFGRRATIFAGACIFTLGGLFQAFATGFRVMVFGRIISGFGVGFLSMCVPVYQSEISPAENRGKLACIEFTVSTRPIPCHNQVGGFVLTNLSLSHVGQHFRLCFQCRTLSAHAVLPPPPRRSRLLIRPQPPPAETQWLDYFCSFITSDLSWRVPLLMQSVIGAVLAIGTLFLPESPRWLIDTEQDEEGMGVLADLHGDGDPEDERVRFGARFPFFFFFFFVFYIPSRRQEQDLIIYSRYVQAQEEFREIKEGVLAEVSPPTSPLGLPLHHLSPRELMMGARRTTKTPKREFGDRSYKAMWRRYRSRVLIACSAQLFAQFVSSGRSNLAVEKANGIADARSSEDCRTESTCTSFLSASF